MRCLFASDLHGDLPRYRRLFEIIRREAPDAVFLGGDLLPSGFGAAWDGGIEAFVADVLRAGLAAVREALGSRAPRVFLIPGNDDPRSAEPLLDPPGGDAPWTFAHARRIPCGPFQVLGYACVPPTPFRLKDWERYDVSRHVDPGCVSPEEGIRSVEADPREVRWGTIRGDLEALAGPGDPATWILLSHAPPYDTPLDRAALDDVRIEHVPADVHVGSIAVRRFIEERQPLLGLHGHVHESARLTGAWRTTIGRTRCFSAAHDGPELAVVHFDPHRPDAATRELAAVD